MKLIRFGERGAEKPGLLLTDGTKIDASAFDEDYNESFFENDGLNRLSNESGLFIPFDVKSISTINIGNDDLGILVGTNQDTLRLYKVSD